MYKYVYFGLRDWIFMKARSRVEIDDALTVWQLKDAVKGKKPDTPK